MKSFIRVCEIRFIVLKEIRFRNNLPIVENELKN